MAAEFDFRTSVEVMRMLLLTGYVVFPGRSFQRVFLSTSFMYADTSSVVTSPVVWTTPAVVRRSTIGFHVAIAIGV